MLAALQGAVTLDSGWVGPLMAISLLIIATGTVVAGVAMLLVLRETKQQTDRIGKLIDSVQKAITPVVATLGDIGEEGRHLAHVVRHEAEALARTSRRMRRKINRGSERVEDRLEDLDALYEVLYDEVSDTALTAASTLRKVRTGGRILRRVRRFFPGSRRR
ncbi:MAG: hypothetical protein ACREL6_01050 [Gemmatimonadales bacterium]